MSDTQPPLEYLVECSNASLESFELSRLNRASNLQKEQSQVTEEWIQAEVSLRVARWILDHRRLETSSPELARQQAARFAPRAQLNLTFVPQLETSSDEKQIDCELSKMSQEQRTLSDSQSGDGRTVGNEDGSTKCHRYESPINAHLESLANQSGMIQKRNAAPPIRSLVSRQATTELFALETYALGPPEAHPPVMKKTPKANVSSGKIQYCPTVRIQAPPTENNSPDEAFQRKHSLLRGPHSRPARSDTHSRDRQLASAS